MLNRYRTIHKRRSFVLRYVRIVVNYSREKVTRNSSGDDNTWTWRDVYCLICLLVDNHSTGTSMDSQLNFNLKSQNIYTDVRIADLCWALYIPSIPGNVIFATVGLVCNNVHPNTSFLVRLVSDYYSRSLEKWVRARSSQPPLREKFLHGVWVLVHSYLRVRFELPSSINFRGITVSPY